MNSTTKKIVAREFLILVMISLLTVCTFLFGYVRDYYVDYRITSLQSKIDLPLIIPSDSLKEIKRKSDNRDWVCDLLRNEFTYYLSDYKSNEILWPELRAMIAPRFDNSLRWDNKSWSNAVINFMIDHRWTPEKLKSFLDQNEYTIPQLTYIKQLKRHEEHIKDLKQEQSELSFMKWSQFERIEYTKNTLYVLLIALFGVRYLFYAIRWSFKTLRS